MNRTVVTSCLAAGLVLTSSPAYAATSKPTTSTVRVATSAAAVVQHRASQASTLQLRKHRAGWAGVAGRVAASYTSARTHTTVVVPHAVSLPLPVPPVTLPVVPPVVLPTSPSGVDLPKGDLPGWKQVMAEDFSGSSLAKGWGSYEGTPGGQPNGKWLHSHTVVGNDVLTLKGYQEAGKFTTGGLMAFGDNIGGLTYGKYEVRFRVAKGHGVMYSMMLWPKAENWPIGGEVDFAEDGGGDRSSTSATAHWGANNSQDQHHLNADFSQWNTLGVEWTPNKLVYTMNGKPWATSTGAAVPTGAMNLAIQTQAGTCGTWAGATCPDGTTPANVDMQVDWATAYSYTG